MSLTMIKLLMCVVAASAATLHDAGLELQGAAPKLDGVREEPDPWLTVGAQLPLDRNSVSGVSLLDRDTYRTQMAAKDALIAELQSKIALFELSDGPLVKCQNLQKSARAAQSCALPSGLSEFSHEELCKTTGKCHGVKIFRKTSCELVVNEFCTECCDCARDANHPNCGACSDYLQEKKQYQNHQQQLYQQQHEQELQSRQLAHHQQQQQQQQQQHFQPQQHFKPFTPPQPKKRGALKPTL